MPVAQAPVEAQTVGSIDIQALVGRILSAAFDSVGGSPAAIGSEGSEERSATEPPETHPTVAVERGAAGEQPPAPATPRPTAAQVPPVLHRIAHCESRGDWTAQNPHSSASGKWQFLDSTWRSQVASGDYRRAKDAPPHIQRAAALELFAAAGTKPWNASRRCWG